jgi:Arc/MetJ-type ribon-helix-helix transcriptional regulator
MVRTQIQLTEDQVRALKKIAAERGISMAEVIRQAINSALEKEDKREKWRRALAIVGSFHSDADDISVEHDKYLAEAYDQ